MEDSTAKIHRHLRNGIVVDANLLVLYLIGLHDSATGLQLVRTFRYTKGKYSMEDFYILNTVLQQFNVQIFTPHILTETSNMIGHLSSPARELCFGFMRVNVIPVMEETSFRAVNLKDDEAFVKFGVTDTGIVHAASNPYLILTDDRPLCGHLEKNGLDAVHFQEIKYST